MLLLKNAINQYIKFVLVLLIPTLLCLCGCNSSPREQPAGTYNAVSNGTSESISATLELQEDGKGFWSIETDNAPFRWDLYQNRIRLHTESGGVIEGSMENDTIRLTLPGMGMIRFERSR